MKMSKLFWRTHRLSIIVIFLILLTIFRIWLGQKIFYWYPAESFCDDIMMLNYASFHDASCGLPFSKTLSYSILLNLVHFSGLPYNLVLSLLWIIAGAILVLAMRKILVQKPWLLVLIYILVIFCPAAFDWTIGARIYRQAVIAPLVIMVMAAAFGLVASVLARSKTKEVATWSGILGLFFTFVFYVKEDGIWLWPMMIMTIGASAGIIIWRSRKRLRLGYKFRKKTWLNFAKWLAVIILPLLIFVATTIVYRAGVEHKTGISSVNLRTDSEFARYVNYLYEIDTPEKSPEKYWITREAITRSFDVSPTLQRLNQEHNFQDIMLDSSWTKPQVLGDYMSWAMADVIKALPGDLVSKNALFKEINQEISEAFANGDLAKDSRIQISHSAIGRHAGETSKMWEMFRWGIGDHIFLNHYGYRVNDQQNFCNVNDQNCREAQVLTNMNLGWNTNYAFENDLFASSTRFILNLYKILLPIGLTAAIIGVVWAIVLIFRRKTKLRSQLIFLVGSILTVVGSELILLFGVAWFSTWLDLGAMHFYGVAALSCNLMIIALGIALLMKILKKRK